MSKSIQFYLEQMLAAAEQARTLGTYANGSRTLESAPFESDWKSHSYRCAVTKVRSLGFLVGGGRVEKTEHLLWDEDRCNLRGEYA